MLGLAVLFFIGVYLLISLLAIKLAGRWARKRGRRGWIWGGLTAFAMYNLVFWDLIPTLVLHKYYCATEAGLWVYKTPEQWVKENPGVRETLSWRSQSGYLRSGNQLNERFILVNSESRRNKLFPITSMETTINDVNTGEIMVKTLRFSSGYGAFGVGMVGSWRYWTRQTPCNQNSELSAVIKQFERLGREIK